MATKAQMEHRRKLRALEANRDRLVMKRDKASADLQTVKLSIKRHRAGKSA